MVSVSHEGNIDAKGVSVFRVTRFDGLEKLIVIVAVHTW